MEQLTNEQVKKSLEDLFKDVRLWMLGTVGAACVSGALWFVQKEAGLKANQGEILEQITELKNDNRELIQELDWIKDKYYVLLNKLNDIENKQ